MGKTDFSKYKKRDEIEHSLRLVSMMEESGIEDTDKERMALFYIISGNDDLFESRYAIYDFKSDYSPYGTIRLDCFETTDFSSGVRKLLLLAFNLYNGYNQSDTNMTPVGLLLGLDKENLRLAYEAMQFRFSY